MLYLFSVDHFLYKDHAYTYIRKFNEFSVELRLNINASQEIVSIFLCISSKKYEYHLHKVYAKGMYMCPALYKCYHFSFPINHMLQEKFDQAV